MKPSVLGLVAILGMAVISPSGIAPAASTPELKAIPVPVPKGVVSAEALDIARAWNPPVVYLKGNAKVTIRTAAKDPNGEVVLQADAAEIDQITGRISAQGNVRLSVQNVR